MRPCTIGPQKWPQVSTMRSIRSHFLCAIGFKGRRIRKSHLFAMCEFRLSQSEQPPFAFAHHEPKSPHPPTNNPYPSSPANLPNCIINSLGVQWEEFDLGDTSIDTKAIIDAVSLHQNMTLPAIVLCHGTGCEGICMISNGFFPLATAILSNFASIF